MISHLYPVNKIRELYQQYSIDNINLAYFCFVLNQFQILSLNYTLYEYQTTTYAINIDFIAIIDCLAYISRPYLMLNEFILWNKYAYLLTLIFFFGLCLYILVHYIFKKIKDKEINYNQLDQTLSFLLQIYPQILKIPMTEFAIISIIYQSQNLDENYLLEVLIYLVLLIQLSFNIFSIQFMKTQQFPCQLFKIDLKSPYSTVKELLLFTFLLIYKFKSSWSLYVSLLLNISIQIIYLLERKEIYNYLENSLIIICISSNLGLTIVILISILLDQLKIRTLLGLLLIPLFHYILTQYLWKLQYLNINSKRSLSQIYNNLVLLRLKEDKKIKLNQLQIFTLKMKQSHLLSNLDENDIFHNELQIFNSIIIKQLSIVSYKWYNKYILIKISQKQYNLVCQIIHNISTGYLHNSQKNTFVKSSMQLSFQEKVELQQLLYYTFGQISRSIIQQSQNLVYKDVYDFINFKKQQDELEQELQQLIQEKIIVLQTLITKDVLIQKNNVFNQCFAYTKRLIQFQTKLEAFYKVYSIEQIKYILITIYSDLENNYLKAQKFNRNFGTKDKINHLNIFSESKIDFASFQVQQDLYSIYVQQISPTLKKQLQLKNIQKPSIETLLPSELIIIHQQLVFQFFKDGKSKYLRQRNPIFLRQQDDVYIFYEFQLFNDQLNNQQMIFYGFFSEVLDQPNIIFINDLSKIIGYTQNVIEYLKIHIPNLQQSQLFNQHINQLMLDFNLNEQLNKEISVQFLKDKYADILIEQKYQIYLVTIIQIRNKSNSLQTSIKQQSINSEEVIYVPYCFEQPKEINSNQEISHYMNKSNIDQSNNIQAIQEQEILVPMSPINSDRNLIIQNKQEQSKYANSKNNNTNNEKNTNNNNQNNNKLQMELQSSKYSKGELDNSIFQRKYSQIDRYLNKKTLSFHFDLMIFCFFILAILNIVNNSLIKTDLIPELERSGNDLDMLAIKSYFIAPSENCVTSQASVVNYIVAYQLYQSLDQKTSYGLLEFSLLAINQSYTYFKDSFINQLNNPNLQEFFLGKTIELSVLNFTDLYKKNYTLKNALYYFLNAQYTISKMDYYNILTDESSKADFAYFMANLQLLNERFQTISDEILAYVVDRIKVSDKQWTKILIKFLLLQFFFIYFGYVLFIEHKLLIQKQFNQITMINSKSANNECQKLQHLLKNIQTNNLELSISFDFKQKEQEIFQTQELFINLSRSNQCVQNHTYYINKYPAVIFIIIILVFIFVLSITQNLLCQQFFQKYDTSSIFLKQLSVVSTAATAVFQLKEVSFMTNARLPFFFFYTEENRLVLNQALLVELEYIKQFSATLNEFDSNQYLVNDQFLDMFNQMKKSNLCDFLLTFSQELASPHCAKAYSGVLQIGLSNTITEIYNQIMQEYVSTDGFLVTHRSVFAALEQLEVGLITSDALLRLKQSYYECLVQITSSLINQIQIILSFSIMIDCVFLCMLFFIMRPRFLKEFMIIKNMVLIIPPQQLYLDQEFDRNFRYLIIKYNL